MNWFSSALPWYGWTILGVVPPLILLLYFLKLRRTPLEVPSTFLWTRTIEDLHVNSIWQRLRNSLLLLLQLLLALLLLLACLQPGCEGTNIEGERFIFLVDNSSSMSATDTPGGESRLEYAKTQIRNTIDAMESDASAMLISFSNQSDVVQSYTKNKSLLKRKLSGITQTQRTTDMSEALTAASGLANPGRTSDRESEIDIQVADALAAKLLIYSDGGVAEVPGFSLGNLEAEYRPVGAFDSPHNVGITAFSISQDLDTESGVQAFLRLQNSDDEDHSVDLSLYADGELFDARGGVAVAKENSKLMSFDLTPLLGDFEDSIRVEVRIEDQDVYANDNVAYGIIEPARKVNVLICTEYGKFLKLALGTERINKLANVTFETAAYLQDKKYIEEVALGSYDLILYDQCAPDAMPDCSTIFFGAAPPSEDWTVGAKDGQAIIIDTLETHPIMNAVQMANVIIAEATPLEGPQGSISLMDATFGSIMSIAPRSGFQDLIVGFTLEEINDQGETLLNSDWHQKLSFPLFVQNCITWLGGAAKFDSSSGSQPGELVRFRTRLPTNSVRIKDPKGRTVDLTARKDKTFTYAAAETIGVYQVINRETGDDDQLLTVNLFDARESNLVVRDELKIGYEELTKTDKNEIPARQEHWTWVILAALLVLLIEWYIYNRRVLI